MCSPFVAQEARRSSAITFGFWRQRCATDIESRFVIENICRASRFLLLRFVSVSAYDRALSLYFLENAIYLLRKETADCIGGDWHSLRVAFSGASHAAHLSRNLLNEKISYRIASLRRLFGVSFTSRSRLFGIFFGYSQNRILEEFDSLTETRSSRGQLSVHSTLSIFFDSCKSLACLLEAFGTVRPSSFRSFGAVQ